MKTNNFRSKERKSIHEIKIHAITIPSFISLSRGIASFSFNDIIDHKNYSPSYIIIYIEKIIGFKST